MVPCGSQVQNSANPPMVADINRTIVVFPRCPLGEVVCSNGISCSANRFCRVDSLLEYVGISEDFGFGSGSLEQPRVPVIKLIGNSIIEVKQV